MCMTLYYQNLVNGGGGEREEYHNSLKAQLLYVSGGNIHDKKQDRPLAL
jgi:hypothetical protein